VLLKEENLEVRLYVPQIVIKTVIDTDLKTQAVKVLIVRLNTLSNSRLIYSAVGGQQYGKYVDRPTFCKREPPRTEEPPD